MTDTSTKFGATAASFTMLSTSALTSSFSSRATLRAGYRLRGPRFRSTRGRTKSRLSVAESCAASDASMSSLTFSWAFAVPTCWPTSVVPVWPNTTLEICLSK